MKKNILKKTVLFLFVSFLFFLNSNIKAISVFPDRITIKVGNLMPDTFRILKKEYVGSDGNSGKAFCSSFWNDVDNNTTCSKTYYHSDSTKNEKAQAAVGAIINNYRNSNGSMSWDNYYYAELAINEFLYKKVTNNVVNNLNRYDSFPNEKEKKIKPAVNIGSSVYDSYKSEVVVVDNLKINNISINNTSKNLSEQFKNAQNYIITADMKCYKDNTKTQQVACSNPNAVLKAKNNSSEKSYTVTKKYNGNTLNLEIDISNLINGNSSELQNIELSLNAESKKTYYLAQRYYCGNNLQTMTPNLLKPSTVTANVTATGKFSITPRKMSCGDEISAVTPYNLRYAVTNANLYSTKYNNYGMLLDINNPSCSPTSSSQLISCDVENGNSAVVNSKKVIHGDIPNQSGTQDYLCTITFSYDSDTMMNKNISSANKLIYQKDDGIIGRAKVNYDCNVPSLTYSGSDSLMEFELDNIAPKLKINLDNTEEYEMGYKIENASSSSSDCTLNDNKITCKNYKTNELGYGWNFEANIVYYYPETFNYSMDVMGNIRKTSGCSNCSKIGYGIYVPGNTEISSKTVSHLSTVKFDFPSDYEVKNNNLTVSCPYTINKNENGHKEILYRTIDTDNPFSSYTGNDRLTGSNWCSDSDVDSFDDIDDFGIDNIQVISDSSTDVTVNKTSKCIYKGDMNENGVWDDNDVDIIQKYISGKYTLNSDELKNADINYDGIVDIMDASTVQVAMRTFAKTLKGDLNSNGIIDVDDVAIVQRYRLEFIDLIEVQKKLADMDNDCRVSVNDATELQRIIDGYYINPSGTFESSYQGDISDDDVYTTLNDKINELEYDDRTKKCVNNNDKVTSIIKNRPNANGDIKIKNEDGTVTKKKAKTPLYKFVLTPDNIKNIRSDNKEKKGYSSFDSVCNENGEKCVSSFISQASDNRYVSNVSGYCTPGTYCDITNVIQQNYIKGGA